MVTLLANAPASGFDPLALLAGTLLIMGTFLLTAKLGGHVAIKLGQLSLLGEMAGGIMVGALVRWLWPASAVEIEGHLLINFCAELGVLVIMFRAGLESSVRDMLRVGPSALVIAIIGVTASFLLGTGMAHLCLPSSSFWVKIFVGMTLTATSVGVSARSLKDLKSSGSASGKLIVAAAVADDVLGLVALAVVTGVVKAASGGGSVSLAAVGFTVVKAVGFLAVAMLIGRQVSRHLFQVASRLQNERALLATSIAFAGLCGYLAFLAGLHPMIGAYCAGLVLEETHYADLRERGEHELEELVEPLAEIFIPLFFVLVGFKVNLAQFADFGVIAMALGFTAAAMLGKLLAGLGAFGKGVDKLTVGIGMMPRGEVVVAVAAFGLTLKIGMEPMVTPTTYSAIVMVVVLTTLAVPILLKLRLSRLATSAN